MNTEPEIIAIELALSSAIEDDLNVTYDEGDYTVLNYLVVAEVLDAEGKQTICWTSTDGIPEYRVWGMLHWLKDRLGAHFV